MVAMETLSSENNGVPVFISIPLPPFSLSELACTAGAGGGGWGNREKEREGGEEAPSPSSPPSLSFFLISPAPLMCLLQIYAG